MTEVVFFSIIKIALPIHVTEEDQFSVLIISESSVVGEVAAALNQCIDGAVTTVLQTLQLY